MCSTRNAFVVGGCIVGLLAGCQGNPRPRPDPLNRTPLVVDEAMQRREWEPSAAYYANGDTIAGGTGYMFQTSPNIPDGWRRVVDPVMTTANILLLPVGLVVNSPTKKEDYQGAIIPPTHTANPPLY